MKILQYPNKTLNKVCTRVTVFDNNLHRLINDMFKIMRENNGVGLAAPQIGLTKRIIVTNCGEPLYLINPILLSSSSPIFQKEGCLSIDNGKRFIYVTRDSHIKVKYQDVKGRFFTHETALDGDILTRCILHEMDHLEGILMLDRASGTHI